MTEKHSASAFQEVTQNICSNGSGENVYLRSSNISSVVQAGEI